MADSVTVTGGVVGACCELEMIQSNAQQLFTEMETPLLKIERYTHAMIDSVRVTMEGTGDISQALLDVVGTMTNFSAKMGSIVLPEGFESEVLASTNEKMDQIVADLDAKASRVAAAPCRALFLVTQQEGRRRHAAG